MNTIRIALIYVVFAVLVGIVPQSHGAEQTAIFLGIKFEKGHYTYSFCTAKMPYKDIIQKFKNVKKDFGSDDLVVIACDYSVSFGEMARVSSDVEACGFKRIATVVGEHEHQKFYDLSKVVIYKKWNFINGVEKYENK